MVAVGTGIQTSRDAVALAKQYKNIWACIGLHPVNCCESFHDKAESGTADKGNIAETQTKPGEDFDFETYKSLADNPKVIAIGECGLDYFHSKPEDISRQKEIFDQHIELANAVKKPLMLHVRNPKSGGSAYKDALEMIKARSKVPFDFHFFAGSLEEALAICDIGGYLSFTGVITFARNYDEVIRSIPIERILSETDCPYVAPVPYRGTRNRPDYVIKVVESLAQIRGIGLEEMSRILLENAERFYGVKF
jgi:TatD DNase family protein